MSKYQLSIQTQHHCFGELA